jgi:hypothetical protein
VGGEGVEIFFDSFFPWKWDLLDPFVCGTCEKIGSANLRRLKHINYFFMFSITENLVPPGWFSYENMPQLILWYRTGTQYSISHLMILEILSIVKAGISSFGG